MPSEADTERALQRLSELLSDQRAVSALLQVQGAALDAQQRRNLRKIVRHFTGPSRTRAGGRRPRVEQSEDGGERDAQHDGVDGSEHHDEDEPREQERPRHPWGRFLKLDAVSLSPTCATLLRSSASGGAGDFLSDGGTLFLEESDANIGDAFIARYRFTRHVERRQAQDRLRWCFCMLLFFDLVQMVRPGAVRVGSIIQHDLSSLLRPVMGQLHLSLEEAQSSVSQWSRCGAKLDTFCKEFGCGSLFYLVELLSEDFLTNKFTATGTYHDEGIAHLHQLNLKQVASQSGANDLGQAIRQYFRQPFVDAAVNR